MIMKTPMIMAAVALIAVGCDRPQTTADADNRSVDQTKDTIQESAREAKNTIEKEAESKKEMIEAEAKSAQAQIEADKARLKSAGAEGSAKVDAAADNIRNAGAAGVGTQTEVGTSPGTVPPPVPAEPVITTPTPAPTPNLSTATDDQKLTEQVRTIVAPAGTDANAAQAVQVTAAGGVVTLKGTVKSEAEKTRIETATKAVAGVTKVENQIEVKAE
jgi:osmotically-inducible protein OsmY